MLLFMIKIKFMLYSIDSSLNDIFPKEKNEIKKSLKFDNNLQTFFFSNLSIDTIVVHIY